MLLGSPPLQPRHVQFESCPLCEGRLLRVESCFNPRADKMVRIYKCSDCHKLTWDD
jgi:uncharacterized protein with PIN domain